MSSNKLNQYFQISKIDEELRMVWGYASTEARDAQGEIITKQAMQDAWDDYMAFGNIREMHQASAVGIVKEFNFDEHGVFIGVEVVDDQAWTKVVKQVYKGFSVGGNKIPEKFDKATKTINALRLTEISLVDRPANPQALIEIFKADNQQEQDMSANTDTPTKVEAVGEPTQTVDVVKDVDGVIATNVEGSVTPATLGIDTVTEALEKGDITTDDLLALLKSKNIIPDANNSTTIPEQNKLSKVFSMLKTEDGVQKGLWTVAEFADAVEWLAWLQISAAGEAQREGDGSTLPAKLAQLVKDAGQCLLDMVKEEVGEMLAEIVLPADPIAALGEIITNADKTGELAKMRSGLDVLKAGARNSQADAELIQKAHDLMTGLGATCDADDGVDKADGVHDHSTDISKALGQFEKMASTIATLEKTVTSQNEVVEQLRKAYNKQPTDPKGAVVAISKAEDGGAAVVADVAPVLKQDGTVDDVATAIKKVHASGGRVLGM